MYMNKEIKRVIEQLELRGVVVEKVSRTKSGHFKASVRKGKLRGTTFFSKTPSDPRSILNMVAQAKKALR